MGSQWGLDEVREYERGRLERTVDEYEELLTKERLARKNAEAISVQRADDLNRLSADADALRLRIGELSARSQSDRNNAADRSNVAKTTQRRWDDKMGAVLREATNLIEERDRIAVDYNTLREQCRLQQKHRASPERPKNGM